MVVIEWLLLLQKLLNCLLDRERRFFAERNVNDMHVKELGGRVPLEDLALDNGNDPNPTKIQRWLNRAEELHGVRVSK